MPNAEDTLTEVRNDLEKVRKMLKESKLRERQQALENARHIEQEQEPLPNPQSFLEEQHHFAEYEQQLQKLLNPTWYTTPSKGKPIRKGKLSKKKANKK